MQQKLSPSIGEFILVDDESMIEYDNVYSALTRASVPFKFRRNRKTRGQIECRNIVAEIEEHPILLFSDAHVRLEPDALSPLLASIKDHSKRIAVPLLDIIAGDTLVWKTRETLSGCFDSQCGHSLENLSTTAPEMGSGSTIISPVRSESRAFSDPSLFGRTFTVNGFFVIHKQRFGQLGVILYIC